MSAAPESDNFLQRAQEGIGSRFQSQASIEKANEQRDKDWQAAYARLGQEPPKQENNFVHDGRTLYERLELNKKLNEEEWDAKMKLGNQYRGLDTEETSFLNARLDEQRAKDRAIREEEARGLAEYRQALAAKQALAEESSPSPSGSTPRPLSTTNTTIRKVPPKGIKKDVKSLMKGVVVKKKPIAKPPTSESQSQAASSTATPSGTASPSNASGTRSGTHTGERKSLATASEMQNSRTVGAAGMTALGKRLVADSPSPSPSPEPDEDRQDISKKARTEV